MFPEKVQKQASRIAFQHDAAPRLFIEYLRTMERDQVIIDLMTSLRRRRSNELWTAIDCDIYNCDVVLSEVGFVHQQGVNPFNRSLYRLNEAKFVTLTDLESAKEKVQKRIMECTENFDKYRLINLYPMRTDTSQQSVIGHQQPKKSKYRWCCFCT